MNDVLKVTIIRVSRNSFVDSKGNEVKYCQFSVIAPAESNDNLVGYDIKKFTTKYDNYAVLSNLLKANKSVNLTCEFRELPDGYYKQVPVKIDETSLK